MDEDGKTLLAVLALLYGSQQGIGLFEKAVTPLRDATSLLEIAVKDPRATPSIIEERRATVRAKLWSPPVLIYVGLVLLSPCFLLVVAVFGATEALRLLGLASAANSQNVSARAPFYIILLILAILSGAQLVSPYLRAWKQFLKTKR